MAEATPSRAFGAPLKAANGFYKGLRVLLKGSGVQGLGVQGLGIILGCRVQGLGFILGFWVSSGCKLARVVSEKESEFGFGAVRFGKACGC